MGNTAQLWERRVIPKVVHVPSGPAGSVGKQSRTKASVLGAGAWVHLNLPLTPPPLEPRHQPLGTPSAQLRLSAAALPTLAASASPSPRFWALQST